MRPSTPLLAATLALTLAACGALTVQRLLVMDGGGALEASQDSLDLIATLTDEERD